jgi:hypothetical protein
MDFERVPGRVTPVTHERNAAQGKYFSFVAAIDTAYCRFGALVFLFIKEYHHAPSQLSLRRHGTRRGLALDVQCGY